jgi:hypothetical protein
MRDGTHQIRSIATELALLFLSELEPRVADDPALLVSTEALLAFGAIRHTDPVQWENWQAILEKYEKSQLVEYMLREPARSEDSVWMSKADRLIGLALDAGLNLFHDPDQQGWASVRVGGHCENHSIRSRDFRLFLLRNYYEDTGESPGGEALRAALELFEARALFDGEECPVHVRVAELGGGSTWICAIALGGPSKSIPRVGALWTYQQRNFAAPAVHNHCLNRSAAAASRSCGPSLASTTTAGP